MRVLWALVSLSDHELAGGHLRALRVEDITIGGETGQLAAGTIPKVVASLAIRELHIQSSHR